MSDPLPLYRYKGKVLRVIDGDTLEVLIDLGFYTFKKAKIRLKGINAPEIFHPKSKEERKKGLEAKKFLSSLFKDSNEVYLRVYKKGKYGRWIVDLLLKDGTLINDLLAERGYASRIED